MTEWMGYADARRVPGLGYARGRLLEARRAPCAVVVHTTGSGPVRRALSQRFALWRHRARVDPGDAFGAAVAVYRGIMDESPHYVISQDGNIVQLVPESHCAWHVGGRGSAPYFTRPGTWARSRRYAWWRERWPLLQTPRELGGGRLWEPYVDGPGLLRRLKAPRSWGIGSANANSIGVEVVAPTANPRGPWSPEAWESLARLVRDICERHAIPVRPEHVITHSDAHPLSRTTASGKPWDPGVSQWDWGRFRSIARTMGGPRVAEVEA